jgi:hypothetical protein
LVNVSMRADLSAGLARFVPSIEQVAWLTRLGEPHPTALVVPDVAAGWDEWNEAMLATWRPHSIELEHRARTAIGDDGIDTVFSTVSATIHHPLRTAVHAWFDRRPNINDNTATNTDLGLWPELLETIERDVAWAGVEEVLATRGFFSRLLALYAEGRWPCAWQGDYPAGRPVVL